MTTAVRSAAWDRLVAPQDAAEARRRAAERAARFAVGRRGPVDERAVPYFARVAGDGRQSASWIAGEVAKTFGVRTVICACELFERDPVARDALCYWLLGLTRMSTGDVARACRLAGEGEAEAAMRRHASRTGFPALDLSEEARGR